MGARREGPAVCLKGQHLAWQHAACVAGPLTSSTFTIKAFAARQLNQRLSRTLPMQGATTTMSWLV